VADLLRMEFKDGDGLRILARCAADSDVPAGANVPVDGRLTRKRADGFVIDQCALR
jgi:hypothetical protein